MPVCGRGTLWAAVIPLLKPPSCCDGIEGRAALPAKEPGRAIPVAAVRPTLRGGMAAVRPMFGPSLASRVGATLGPARSGDTLPRLRVLTAIVLRATGK